MATTNNLPPSGDGPCARNWRTVYGDGGSGRRCTPDSPTGTVDAPGLLFDLPPADNDPAELLKRYGCELGDTWQVGRHFLTCGDARDPDVVARLLMGAVPVLMVTDPPYGVNFAPEQRAAMHREKSHVGTRASKMVGRVTNDHTAAWADAYRHFPGDVAHIWHAAEHTPTVYADLDLIGFRFVAQIIWNKPQHVLSRGDYHWKHEPAVYAVRKGGKRNWQGRRDQNTVWDIAGMSPFGASRNAGDGKTGHGTQKPLECMARPIRNLTAKGEDVYDPFAGSGTTLVACEQLDRRAFCIELEPTYCAIILHRAATTFPGIYIHKINT